jgi:hypothetical protein
VLSTRTTSALRQAAAFSKKWPCHFFDCFNKPKTNVFGLFAEFNNKRLFLFFLAASDFFAARLTLGLGNNSFLRRIGQNAGLGAAAFESLQRVVQRLIVLSHGTSDILFPSLQYTPGGALRAIQYGMLTGIL